MSKLKTLLATATVVVGATLSLTLLTSAATVNTASYASNSQKGYYTTKETDGKIEKYSRTFTQHSKYATFSPSFGTAAIIGSANYSGNYKTSYANLRTAKKSSMKSNWGTSTTVKTAKADLGSYGPATKATFMGSLYDGTDSGSDFLSGYIINVYKS